MTAHPIDTEALRRLADQATPGPWEAITDRYDSEIGWYMGGHIPNVADEFRTEHDGDHPPLGAEDAEFIAAARTAVPALLGENEALRARIAEEKALRMKAAAAATRAEAQSEARRIDMEYWKEAAKAGQRDVDHLSREWSRDRDHDREVIKRWRGRAEEAEARIKAVRDVLDVADSRVAYDTRYAVTSNRMDTIVNGADIRRALDGDS